MSDAPTGTELAAILAAIGQSVTEPARVAPRADDDDAPYVEPSPSAVVAPPIATAAPTIAAQAVPGALGAALEAAALALLREWLDARLPELVLAEVGARVDAMLAGDPPST